MITNMPYIIEQNTAYLKKRVGENILFINMILKRKNIILTGLIILPILFLLLYSNIRASQYKDLPIPKITANSTKELVVSLINSEELFFGDVSTRFINANKSKIEIKIYNESTGSDSTEANEIYVIAAQNEKGWSIIEYKQHWKCRERLFSLWTTQACS